MLSSLPLWCLMGLKSLKEIWAQQRMFANTFTSFWILKHPMLWWDQDLAHGGEVNKSLLWISGASVTRTGGVLLPVAFSYVCMFLLGSIFSLQLLHAWLALTFIDTLTQVIWERSEKKRKMLKKKKKKKEKWFHLMAIFNPSVALRIKGRKGRNK